MASHGSDVARCSSVTDLLVRSGGHCGASRRTSAVHGVDGGATGRKCALPDNDAVGVHRSLAGRAVADASVVHANLDRSAG